MAEIRQIGRLTIHFLGDNAARLVKSFDGSFAGSQAFRDAMGETSRTQKHIYVGSSLEDLRDQPGFDRAGFNPGSRAVSDTNAFGKPSGAESYFIVVTNKEHHLLKDGQIFPGSIDLSLAHELLHPSQIIRELTEFGGTRHDSEARTQMREQKIAEELGRIPGQDFPDVLGSGIPYEVQLDPTETQPRSTPPGKPVVPTNPMKYDGGTPPDPSVPVSPQLHNWSGPRLTHMNGSASPSRNPNAATSLPETDGPIGIFSGKPMPRWPVPPPIFNTRDNSGAAGGNWLTSALLRGSRMSQPSSFDANGSPASFAPNRQSSLNSGNASTAPSDPGDAPDPPTSPSQDSQGPLTLNDAYLEYLKRLNANQPPVSAFEPSAPAVPRNSSSIAQPPDDDGPLTLMEAYQQYRKRLDANQPQASAFGAGAPAAPLAPSDDSNLSGGLVGRLTALMRQYPDVYGPPPPEDDEMPSYYGLMLNR
jgi:hypothetical protein